MSTAEITAGDQAMTWTDPKRHLWLLGLVVPMLPFLAYGIVEATGLGVFWWFGPMWIIGFIPVVDAIFGTDEANAPEWAVPDLEADHFYRWCTYLFLPLQAAGLVWGAWMFLHGGLSTFEQIGLAFTVGSVAGIGIANAHELGHKKEKIERRLSKVVLAQTCYGHFYVEHNRGHHARVATPEDPASSRLGETFWEFLPRTVVGSATSAWALEAPRFRRQGKSPWTLKNDVLNAWAMSVVLFAVMIAGFGVAIVPFLLIQAIFGFSLLEVVNYVEHYGLLRQQDETGRYERCRPEHSWNSNQVASNVLLYHLERHSDHHAHPTRRYQALRHFDEAPQLPGGYGGMIGLAYVPPLWRRVMDKRVLAHYEGDVTLANIHPRTREKVVARYGTTT